MARRSASSPIRRVVLERAAHPLLARYLTPHAAYFEAHGVDLGVLAAAPQDDRHVPHRIYRLLSDGDASPQPPEALTTALTSLDQLASPDGAAELVRIDREQRLPRNTYAAEDLAIVALLDHPTIAATARVGARQTTEQKFQEYAPTRSLRHVRFDETVVEKLKGWLSERFAEIDHTAYCAVEVLPQAEHVEIEIDHGTPARARDTIDKASLTIAQRTDHVAKRVFARFERATGRLCIKALVGARDIVRRGLGIALTGEADLFKPGGLYSLAPFRDLASALEPRNEIRAVELRMLLVRTKGGTKLEASSPTDLLADEASREALALHTRVGTPTAVRFYLHHAGAPRPIRVELSSDDRHNAVEFDRRSRKVVRIVEGFLRERGILCDASAELDDAVGELAT